MDKLQWCKDNAPEALKGSTDDEILDVMSTAYEEELGMSLHMLPRLEELQKISYQTSIRRSTNKLKVTDAIMTTVCQDALSYSDLVDASSYWKQFDARVKTPDSIERKVVRNPDKEFQSVFNDILGVRIICDEYPTVFPEYYRVVDMRSGKQVDDGYRAIHLYYKMDNYHYIIEIQLWSKFDSKFNNMTHTFGYKSIPADILRQLYIKYGQGCIRTMSEYIREARKLWKD